MRSIYRGLIERVDCKFHVWKVLKKELDSIFDYVRVISYTQNPLRNFRNQILRALHTIYLCLVIENRYLMIFDTNFKQLAINKVWV